MSGIDIAIDISSAIKAISNIISNDTCDRLLKISIK